MQNVNNYKLPKAFESKRTTAGRINCNELSSVVVYNGELGLYE